MRKREVRPGDRLRIKGTRDLIGLASGRAELSPAKPLHIKVLRRGWKADQEWARVSIT
jgi:hypothetical protein